MPIEFFFSILEMPLIFTINFMSLKSRSLAKHFSALVIFLDYGLLDLISDYGPFKAFIVINVLNINQSFSWLV